MIDQVPFIDRDEEIRQIARWLDEWGTRSVICIQGDGGIGKTRLLQEVYKRYAQQAILLVANLIDFDNRALQIPENIGSTIAHSLSERVFAPYLRAMRDYQKMGTVAVSPERLAREEEFVDRTFVENFNQVSKGQRVVVLMDTTDALAEGSEAWNYLLNFSLDLNNVLILIAGRNADTIWENLRSQIGKDAQLLKLEPLGEDASKQYLQKKQELLHVTIDPEIFEKLLLLARGRPVLIDLAAEWISRDIQLSWLVQESLAGLQKLTSQKLLKRQEEFEHHLVSHVAKVRTPMDRLILAASRVHPLDSEMIAELLNLSQEEAEALFKEAQTYVFIKLLPDGQITLHDEMRRLVSTLWPEIDHDGNRRRRDSHRAAIYFERKVNVLKEQIERFSKEVKAVREVGDTEAELDISLKKEELEKNHQLLERRRLEHLLFADFTKGMEAFAELCDYATDTYHHSYRRALIDTVQCYAQDLSPEQRYTVDIRRAQHMLDVSDYEGCQALLLELLVGEGISPAQQIETLILLGNVEIRLGDPNAITRFERAVEISKAHNLDVWLMRSLNALGWQHRVRGNLDRALELYESALEISIKLGEKQDQGWILNNIAFVHALNRRNTQVAIAICDQALEIWQELDYPRGVGATYDVYGTAYRRAEQFDKALQYFNQALRIFGPANDVEWLSRVYMNRGHTYWLADEPEKSEEDLKRALDFGIRKDAANILHQLSHAYTKQGRLKEAQEALERSYEISLQTADGYYECNGLGDLIKLAGMTGEVEKLDKFARMYEEFDRRWTDAGFTNVKGRLLKYLGDLALQATPEDVAQACEYYRQAFPLLTYEPYTQLGIAAQLKDMDKLIKRLGVLPQQVAELGRCLYATWKEMGLSHPEALRFFFAWMGREAVDDAEK